MQPTQELAHIYAVQNELGLVKIGFAHNPAKRFKTIEANSGLKIVESYVSPVCFNFAEIEKSLHNQFAAYRKAGEWFSVDFNTVKKAIDTHFLTVDARELTTPALKSLIPISQSQIGTDTVQAVDARTLHQWLEVKSRFNDWIRNRISEYEFVENQDYISLTKNLVSGGQSTDYLISLDMAKELSMVEKTAKGKEARQYFIACEKALRNPGQSLDDRNRALLYTVVKQVIQETLQTTTENLYAVTDETDSPYWEYQWERKILSYLMTYDKPYFTLKDIATDCLAMTNVNRRIEMHLHQMLKRLGYVRKQNTHYYSKW
jgi:phage anti-repressor protein